MSVTPFKPEAHKGHKVEARGCSAGYPTDARLNLTSLQMVGQAANNGQRVSESEGLRRVHREFIGQTSVQTFNASN